MGSNTNYLFLFSRVLWKFTCYGTLLNLFKGGSNHVFTCLFSELTTEMWSKQLRKSNHCSNLSCVWRIRGSHVSASLPAELVTLSGGWLTSQKVAITAETCTWLLRSEIYFKWGTVGIVSPSFPAELATFPGEERFCEEVVNQVKLRVFPAGSIRDM